MTMQLAWAQKKQAVYLKNGSIINGIVEVKEDQISVRTSDGSLWVFDREEVQTVNKALQAGYQKSEGFINMTHFSFMVGKSDRDWNQAAYISPSIRTYIGYHLKQYLAIGLSTGIDGYTDMTLIPVALGLRGDLTQAATTVYYGLDIGGAVPWVKSEDWGNGAAEYKGGFMLSPMIGIKCYGHRGGGFYMQAAWNRQTASSSTPIWGGGSSDREQTYKRVNIGVGLFF